MVVLSNQKNKIVRIFILTVILALLFVLSSCADSKELKITQYDDVSGNQAMFYTIERGNTFIVVDGGWIENADHVREIIKKHGGEVDAWILTHPHPDHIGAFNTIYQDPQGIKIKDVYASEVDYDTYAANVEPWDGFEVFEEFYGLAKDNSQIQYLCAGDSIDINNIHIDFYHSYFEEITDYVDDIANQSSLVFKVSGETESMLFCGDTLGEVIDNYIIEGYGNQIKDCTYLQLGHHGNNTCVTSFIDHVNPSMCFFDAPVWLMTSEAYTARDTKAYLDSKGIRSVSYETVPNEIILK